MVIIALLMAIASMFAMAFLFRRIEKLEELVAKPKDMVEEPKHEEVEKEKSDPFSNDLQRIMNYSPSPKKRNELKRRGVD